MNLRPVGHQLPLCGWNLEGWVPRSPVQLAQEKKAWKKMEGSSPASSSVGFKQSLEEFKA